MENKRFIRIGLHLPVDVVYTHHTGEPAVPDCASVPESVEILDIVIADAGPVTQKQFEAIMDDFGTDIIDDCLEHAGNELESAGWKYDPYARVWFPPNVRQTEKIGE